MPIEQAKTKTTSRSVVLFFVVLAAWQYPVSQDIENYYWILFCAEIFISCVAIALYAPASWAVAIIGFMLASCHVAGSAWWNNPIPRPDPYGIIIPTLEYLQLAFAALIPLIKAAYNGN